MCSIEHSKSNKISENSESVQNFDVELMCGLKSYGILAGTENHRKKTQSWCGKATQSKSHEKLRKAKKESQNSEI